MIQPYVTAEAVAVRDEANRVNTRVYGTLSKPLWLKQMDKKALYTTNDLT